MVENIYIQNRDSIRRNYLIALGINWVVLTLEFLYYGYCDFSNRNVYDLMIGGLLGFFGIGLVHFIPYHFAYKKHGTKLLMLHLFAGPLKFIQNIIQSIQSMQSLYEIIFYLILMIPYILMFRFLLGSTYNIYKLNSAMHKNSSSSIT